MVKIKKQLIKRTRYSYGNSNKKKYITIHQTGNTGRGANAQSHANLQSGVNSREAAWHYQVDDKQAVQSFTHDFQLWQSGDGRGDGNLNSIAIEICINRDGDYKKAISNASELVKHIMKQERIGISRVVQHNKWSGKNCPAQIRAGKSGINWNSLIKMVTGIKGTSTGTSTSTKASTSTGASKLPFGILRQGSRGNNVKKLQNKLNSVYFKVGKADGIYGPKTKDAVARVQKVHDPYNVDGIYGPRTRKILERL